MKKLFTTLLILLAGCSSGGSEDSGDNPCSMLNIKLSGGEQCNISKSPVIVLAAFDAGANLIGVCSATMVTVNDALTAAHCSELGMIPGVVDVVAYVNEEIHSIVNGANHPLWDGQTGSPYDVAMLTIDKPINIGPVPLILSDPLSVGEKITVYGYGQTNNSVDNVGFRGAYMEISALTPEGFFSASKETICPGDSGGPAIQEVNGIAGLVGVSSFGILLTGGSCQSGNIGGFINVQNPQIYEFIHAYASDVAIR